MWQFANLCTAKFCLGSSKFYSTKVGELSHIKFVPWQSETTADFCQIKWSFYCLLSILESWHDLEFPCSAIKSYRKLIIRSGAYSLCFRIYRMSKKSCPIYSLYTDGQDFKVGKILLLHSLRFILAVYLFLSLHKMNTYNLSHLHEIR